MYHGLEDRKVWIEFPGTSEWPAQSRLCYDLTDGGSIDLEFEFEFGAALEGFEAFIASYFHGGRLPYVCLHDGWSSPEPGEQCQLFIPRDEAGASLPGDGRWDWLEERGIRVAIHPDKYRLAVLVDWDRKTGWALVQMIDPDACPSISINSFCHAQDISLLGQDVERGEKVRVRGRIAYICIEDLEEIEHVYRAFLAEVR
jgi:hypothetical protein